MLKKTFFQPRLRDNEFADVDCNEKFQSATDDLRHKMCTFFRVAYNNTSKIFNNLQNQYTLSSMIVVQSDKYLLLQCTSIGWNTQVPIGLFPFSYKKNCKGSTVIISTWIYSNDKPYKKIKNKNNVTVVNGLIMELPQKNAMEFKG